MDGGCGGETSNQGFCEIDCHKAKPKEAKGQLTQTGENRENTSEKHQLERAKNNCFEHMDGWNVLRLT